MADGPLHEGATDGHDAGIVVPIRSFTAAKARLAPRLDPAARASLAQALAETVVRAAGSLPLVVVSSAPEVRFWAAGHGLHCIEDPGTLDGAADAGRAWVAARELARVVVAHADLPHARSLAVVAAGGADSVATLVPCHRQDGTPVLAVPVDTPFRFHYGPGSFRRHVDEAHRCQLEVRVARDPDLAFDVDVPSDLDGLTLRTSAM
jgi:2-phospho-L-lactate/phosphoenolpyruvate guanylyltransferase